MPPAQNRDVGRLIGPLRTHSQSRTFRQPILIQYKARPILQRVSFDSALRARLNRLCHFEFTNWDTVIHIRKEGLWYHLSLFICL